MNRKELMLQSQSVTQIATDLIKTLQTNFHEKHII